jgi:hypothetical protein
LGPLWLDNKIKLLPSWDSVSFRILTSKHSAGVTAQCFVWFSRSSIFCKRCFVILILSLIFWPHSKSVPIQALDFVDFVVFAFFLWPFCYCFLDLTEKCEPGMACSIQGILWDSSKEKESLKKKKNREPLHSFKVPGMERRMTDMKDALWKWSKLYFF